MMPADGLEDRRGLSILSRLYTRNHKWKGKDIYMYKTLEYQAFAHFIFRRFKTEYAAI
jgi:hypothetical protein